MNIVNYDNEQHYIVFDRDAGMTYAFYVKRDHMSGWVTMRNTPHLETVINTGRPFTYRSNEIMYNFLSNLLDSEFKAKGI